jgi:thiamine biosynthesis lipoprotein
MASELQLVLVGELPEPAWQHTVDLLDHLESRWSRFLPDSDVSRLNVADGRPVRVDSTTIMLLTTMTEAWHATEQRFDPCTLRALVAAGYRSSLDDPDRVTVLPSGTVRLTQQQCGEFRNDDPTLDSIEIDPDACTVRLPAGLSIDAGGIGKGLAADLAVASALRSGADGALVSIGGDLSMGGNPPDGGWTVAIEHPEPERGTVGSVAVPGGGVATSSTRSRRWQRCGRERHHVIDPWTGLPSTTDLSSVTVLARSGWLAEVHATAAILAGSSEVIEYLGRHELSGLAVAGDDRVLATDDLAELRPEPASPSMTGATR